MTDTERIDLDDLDVGGDEEESEESKRGDWLWGDGEAPEAAETASATSDAGADATDDQPTDARADATGDQPTDTETVTDSETATDAEATPTDDDSDATESSSAENVIPHVPRKNQDKPVGIPVEQGGAGAGATGDETAEAPARGEADGDPEAEQADPRPGSAADYHDADVDDMTMAITYTAVRRLANPSRALNEARGWSDWIGIVGKVPTHQINKFQREHRIDADFFNGTGSGPGERLAEIDRNSMFFAERMVVVGVAGEDERIAATADWEFVALSEAAEKAGWELTDE